MVPNAWNITTLGEHVSISSGYSPSKYNLDVKGPYPFVKVEDMNNCVKYQQFSRNYTELNGSPVSKGAVIFPKRGAAIMNNKVRITATQMYLDTNMMSLMPQESLCSEFLYYTLVKEELHRIADTSTIPQINNKHILPYRFKLPPLPEQRKIAKTLSTWDKAISATERLIDNSKQQKKALMQQLLTGTHSQRKRLLDDSGKPFEGEWEEVKLESVVVKTQLGTSERTKENKDLNVVPLIKMGNLTWGGFNFNKLETVPKSIVDESLALQVGDFLFNTRNTPELVGKSAVWKGQLAGATFDNNINRISFNPSINTDFICFYLNHGKGKAIVNSLPAGSTSVAAIYWKDLKNIKVPLPTIEEQTKIVSVLINADKEIELLEQQYADLKQEKKALMQQLLTGKRRVKI
jgi:type I restriction enzyme S subunit